jgi:molybdopterin/thiamine biosynthesis adenylyltransferase
MSELGDRHAGTLDGTLAPLGERRVSVAIEIEPGWAGAASVQHTASMLVNLLCRLEGLVDEVRIDPVAAPVHPNTFALAPQARDLGEALLATAAVIGGVAALAGSARRGDRVLRLGPGGGGEWLRVHGEGYCGAISESAIDFATDSPLPFGPYVAACLAAGEIFCCARLPEDAFEPSRGVSYSAWDDSTGAGTIHQPGPELGQVHLDIGLAGVGAVGCALVHALWAARGIDGAAVIADSDEDGIELSNLNRCVLFGAADIGKPKATTAAAVCSDSPIDLIAVDGPYARDRLPRIPALLVSAVDTNRARDQLQQGFWPARLFGASTNDLRAEVIRCGPPGEGPCLRCYNPPEADIPDDVHRDDLRRLSVPELESFAAQIDRPLAEVKAWAEEGGCSEVGDSALRHLRETDEPPRLFSVGFVSVLAGTLLAAELVKEHIAGAPGLDAGHQSLKFQLLRPGVAANGRPRLVPRDPACPACVPGSPGVAVWRRRAETWPQTASVT